MSRVKLFISMKYVFVFVVLSLTGIGYAETNALWTIDRCVRFGLRNSPKLQREEFGPLRQELTTEALRNKFAVMLDMGGNYASVSDKTRGAVALKKELPGSVDLTASASKDDGGDSGDGGESYLLRANKLILGGGSIRASKLAIDNSLLEETVSLNSLSLSRRRLSNQITTQYYQVIRDIQTLKVRRMQQQRGMSNLEHAIERDEPLDIANAELDVKENEVSVLRAERAIDSSSDKLKEIMGFKIDEDLLINPDVKFIPETVDVSADLQTCFNEHEEILNQKLNIKKVENELWVRKREIIPSVNLFGTLQRDDSDSESGDLEHTAGIDLSWEVGSGASRSRVGSLRYKVKQEEISLYIIEREKQLEIRDLGRRLKEQQRQVELSQERIVVQERRLELYRDRWDNGEIDILEFIRSQNDLENSRVILVTQATTYMGLLSDYRLATVTDEWKIADTEPSGN